MDHDYWIEVRCATCGESISENIVSRDDLGITDALTAAGHEQDKHAHDDEESEG